MNFFLSINYLIGFLLIATLYKCHRKKRQLRKTLILCVFLFSSSYLAAFYSFMNIGEARILPATLRTKGDTGLGHTAIILLAHGEPETYDPSAWIRQMHELDEQNTPFIPFPFRPFFFYQLREKYLLAGKSGHNFECLQILREIESDYRKKGDSKTKFYISYLESEPRPDAAVIQALNEGASRIVLCNLFITISSHTQEAVNMIDTLNLEDYGVEIKYTKPLYDSKTLQQCYVDKINLSTVNLDKNQIGIILIGHGQPPSWDKKFYSQTQQEISFRQDIFSALKLQGYPFDHLKLAWMEFRKPKPKEAVRQLLDSDATDIFYFSTIIGSESIHAKYDVPALMNGMKLPSAVQLKQLTAFDDKSALIRALVERIEECR